jgi:hypothetical protein
VLRDAACLTSFWKCSLAVALPCGLTCNDRPVCKGLESAGERRCGVGVGNWIRVDGVSIAEMRSSVALEEGASTERELPIEVMEELGQI